MPQVLLARDVECCIECLTMWFTFNCVMQLHNEKVQLLEKLNRRGETSKQLRELLKLTYLKEHSHWVNRKSTAEKQLSNAKKQVIVVLVVVV